MNNGEFKKQVLQGIPDELPDLKPYDHSISHAPKRRDILTTEEKKLALQNALRYFPACPQIPVCLKIFVSELDSISFSN